MNKNILIKALAYNNQVRIIAINNTNMLETLNVYHPMKATSSAAIGRLMAVSSMMGSLLKNNESVKIKVEGDGPIGYIYSESLANGDTKAYISNKEVYLKYDNGPKKDHLAVGKAIGENGTLYVTKDLKMKNNFTSSIPLTSGEIGDDFTYYFYKSEQTPSSVGVGVLVSDSKILVSGGFILQLLPNATEEVISIIEEKISQIKPVTEFLIKDKNPKKIIEYLSDNDFNIVEELNPKYHCGCDRDFYLDKLYTLKKTEIKEMLEEDQKIQVECNFCNKKYIYTEKDFK